MDQVFPPSPLPIPSMPRVIGRYALYTEFAHGGMATVHLGRLLGPVGFSRTVAIKRLHPQYAKDPDFVSMFVDEARLAARIRHPNVVSTLDVVSLDGELFLVMDYVQGETLARLLRLQREAEEFTPPKIALAVITQVLAGLHAAHEARNERGELLGLVHRDMSPQNVMVGVDGVARVLDFGIAKAEGRVQTTREGQLKGKLSYVAPEQLKADVVSRRTDVYASAVTLWEFLTGRRLFKAESEWQLVNMVMEADVEPPSVHAPGIPPELDDVVMRGLARDPNDRFASAFEMALALERVMPLASAREVGEWVSRIGGLALAQRAMLVAEIETDSAVTNVVSVAELRGALAAAIPAQQSTVTMLARMAPPSMHDGNFSTYHSVAPEPQGRRGRAALLIGTLMLAAGLGAYAFMMWNAGKHEVASVGPATPIESVVHPVVPEVAPPLSLDEPKVAPSATTLPVPVVGVPHPPMAPKATVPALPSPIVSASSSSNVAPPPPVPRAPDCSPPYTVDSDGIRHPKSECL